MATWLLFKLSMVYSIWQIVAKKILLLLPSALLTILLCSYEAKDSITPFVTLNVPARLTFAFFPARLAGTFFFGSASFFYQKERL